MFTFQISDFKVVYNGYPFKFLGGTPARLLFELTIILMVTRDGVKIGGGGRPVATNRPGGGERDVAGMV